MQAGAPPAMAPGPPRVPPPAAGTRVPPFTSSSRDYLKQVELLCQTLGQVHVNLGTTKKAHVMRTKPRAGPARQAQAPQPPGAASGQQQPGPDARVLSLQSGCSRGALQLPGGQAPPPPQQAGPVPVSLWPRVVQALGAGGPACLLLNTHRPTLPHGSGFLALHVNQTL